jgi:hypothetical protein
MKGQNLRKKYERKRLKVPTPPAPEPYRRSPIAYMPPSMFERISSLGSRFNQIISSSPPTRKSLSDDEDFTAKITPKRRPPPPWLAEKIYGQQKPRESQPEEDSENSEEDEGPPGFRRRIR